MALTEANPKFWAPDPNLIKWLTNKLIAPDAKVLEIGPGETPFRRANVFIDVDPPAGLQNCVKANFTDDGLPFADKEFDFIYCRHTLEDLWNPFRLCEEMSRVGKAGYVECPSPIVECGRGVDGGSPAFRGYHHHRWIVWTANKELRFVSKYAFIEYVRFDEASIDEWLKSQRYWNTHYCWTDQINVVHKDNNKMDYSIPRDYVMMLTDAMKTSKNYTDDFYFPIDQLTRGT